MSFDPWATSSGAYGHHAVVAAQEKRFKLIQRQLDGDAKLAAQLQAQEWQQIDERLRLFEERKGKAIARRPDAEIPSSAEVAERHCNSQ